MQDPKYQVGQKVEGLYNALGYAPAVVEDVIAQYAYRLRFTDRTYAGPYERVEEEIRLPRPSPEEAWEKATMLIGIRARIKGEYCCLDGQERLDFNKETRHQVYQILGSAGIKVTDEVKTDVVRLIGIADSL